MLYAVRTMQAGAATINAVSSTQIRSFIGRRRRAMAMNSQPDTLFHYSEGCQATEPSPAVGRASSIRTLQPSVAQSDLGPLHLHQRRYRGLYSTCTLFSEVLEARPNTPPNGAGFRPTVVGPGHSVIPGRRLCLLRGMLCGCLASALNTFRVDAKTFSQSAASLQFGAWLSRSQALSPALATMTPGNT